MSGNASVNPVGNPRSAEEVWYGCLASQHGLGYAAFGALVGGLGSARAVYLASPEARKFAYPALSEPCEASIAAFARRPDFAAWHRLREGCERIGARVLAPDDPGYPDPLKALDAPPPLLYVQGTWLPRDARAAALVGTREPTAYGRQTACELARNLCGAGFTVVSGLALGIDAAAHAGALAEGGRTLAVIGCGLDIPYPRENLGLRARLVESGAVLSEHPPGTQPYKGNYPRRNRLISALSRAVIVVEAGATSGALITAAHARRQGVPLFAVPGPIFSHVSEGSHALLRKGARLLSSAEDVIAHVDGRAPARAVASKPRARVSPSRASSPASSPARASRKALPLFEEADPADRVLRLWESDAECGLDALSARAAAGNLWPAERASAELLDALLRLELGGRVERVPGPAFRLR